jgi:hypothetical protein
MTNICCGGLSDEAEDFLRSSAKSLQQGLPVCCAIFQRIHHFNQLSGGHPLVLQLFLALFLLFAQRLDLLKAIDELLLSIGDHLLQLLDVICMPIQHILDISM